MILRLERLGEFLTVTQTRDDVGGLHERLEFFQPGEYSSGYANTGKKVFYSLNIAFFLEKYRYFAVYKQAIYL